MKKLIIAVDGFSSCGKSTMAKSLAKTLGYTYIDSGAMYRALSLYCLRKGLLKGQALDEELLRKRLDKVKITFQNDEKGVANFSERGEC